MDDRPGYYAVIPADVRYDDSLQPNAKLLYGEISALISKDGFCFAQNAYFAKIYGLSERTISALIAALQDRGYISVYLERDASGQIIRRKIFLKVSAGGEQPVENIFYTSGKDFLGGMEKNCVDTNTSITDIDKENKKESPAPRKARAPKTNFDPAPQMISWIRKTFPDGDSREKNALYLAMVRFADNRNQIKKPMKSNAAVTALCNKLQDLSGGDIRVMADLLDTATVNNWQSIYPPKVAAVPASPTARREEEWL